MTQTPAFGKKIGAAVVEPVGGHGGCNFYDFSLCESLTPHGIEPTLYTCDETSIAGTEGFSVRLSYRGIFGNAPAWRRGLRYLRGSVLALMGSRLSGARIAHFHFYHVGPLELFNVVFARLLGYGVVITAHDVESFSKELSVYRFVVWAYGCAHRVIAHNEISRRELREHARVQDEKIEIIRHGNHVRYFSGVYPPQDARRRVGVDSDDFVILFFGQIKEVKGLDILIRAMRSVRRGGSRRVRLVVAGKVWKDDFAKYQQLINELGLTDLCVLHVRYIPDEELPWFYACADVIVLPYKRIYQSGVVLMAMSFGLPVMVSNIPGMLEVVTDDVNGLVFESGDPENLASRLLWAIAHPERLREIGKQGREQMLRGYSWGAIGQQTADCYRKALSA